MEANLNPTPKPISDLPAAPPPRAVTDLSPRMVQLAREIERLPPGNYEISLQKQELRAQDWSVEIVRTEMILTTKLSRHSPPE